MTRSEIMDMLATLCRAGKLDWMIHDTFIDASYRTTPYPYDKAHCMLDAGGRSTYNSILLEVLRNATAV